MPISGQPPVSPSLQQALELLAQGKAGEADVVVTKAAKQAKAQFGSGSHPLARAYADMARLHFHAGDFKKAATEFRHAGDSPMPSEPKERADRLAFMFGFAACLEALDKPTDAEKVYRQCVEFAKVLHGPSSAGYAAALEPLAALLLKTGQAAEATRIMDEAFEILWHHDDLNVRSTAARRAIWSFTQNRAPSGILESIEIDFEPGGTIHLVPKLTREPDAGEAVQLEMVLTQAVDDLYSRPRKPGH